MTMAMSRQKQFVAVFYRPQEARLILWSAEISFAGVIRRETLDVLNYPVKEYPRHFTDYGRA